MYCKIEPKDEAKQREKRLPFREQSPYSCDLRATLEWTQRTQPARRYSNLTLQLVTGWATNLAAQ